MLSDYYKYCSRELEPHPAHLPIAEVIKATELRNGARLDFTRRLTGLHIGEILKECEALDSETSAKIKNLLRGPIARIKNTESINSYMQS